MRRLSILLLGLLLALLPHWAMAAQDAANVPAAAAPAGASAPTLPSLPNVTVGKIGNQSVSLPLQTLLVMTAITLIPSALLAMTAFTRIIIVLGLLRQALGTGQTPSNQVLVGLALFLTMLVMMPVGTKAWRPALRPISTARSTSTPRGSWAARRSARSCWPRCATPT